MDKITENAPSFPGAFTLLDKPAITPKSKNTDLKGGKYCKNERNLVITVGYCGRSLEGKTLAS